MDVMSVTASRTPFDALGPAASVAYNPQAPTDEVEDAGTWLMKAYSGFGLPKQIDIYSIVSQMEQLKRAERSGDRLLVKALSMIHPEAAEQKARTEPWMTKIAGGGKYIPKPGIPMPVLRMLSKRIEVAQAIHRVWIRKIQGFSNPSDAPDKLGFQLYPLDPGAELGPRENDYLQWLAQFLVNGGRAFSPLERKRKRSQPLSMFLQKAVNDSLTFDFVCTELIPLQMARGIDSFFVRDGATFFLANFGREIDEDEVFAYQIAYGTQEIPFSFDELAIWQRNLDSDLNTAGYGISELEASVDTLSN